MQRLQPPRRRRDAGKAHNGHGNSHGVNILNSGPIYMCVYMCICVYVYMCMCVCVCDWRTKLLITRNGHGQSGWSPIGCEGFTQI